MGPFSTLFSTKPFLITIYFITHMSIPISPVLLEENQANQRNEMEMKSAFRSSVKDILARRDVFIKSSGALKIGFEMEASIIFPDGNPVPEVVRNKIKDEVPHADPELGAQQIEWRTDPINIAEPNGLTALVSQAISRDTEMSLAASHSGANIVRLGTQPLIPLTEIVRTDKEKYKKVPDFHNENRFRRDTKVGLVEQVDMNDAAVVALLNSLQCNLEAESLEDAVDLTNRSLMIGPLAVAISGNARFLEGKDTGFNDIRATAWEVSHDTRTEEERKRNKGLRIGLPEDYFVDIEDYFARVASHPFILHSPENALKIGIGLFWQDTRIKIIDDSAVVEFRSVSIQPSVREDIAVMLFYLGRLQWSKMTSEELVPIDNVREQRALAMQVGIQPFLETLPLELQRAQDALSASGMSGEELKPFFDILDQRVRNGKTPSDIFSEKVKRNSGVISVNTLLQNE